MENIVQTVFMHPIKTVGTKRRTEKVVKTLALNPVTLIKSAFRSKRRKWKSGSEIMHQTIQIKLKESTQIK